MAPALVALQPLRADPEGVCATPATLLHGNDAALPILSPGAHRPFLAARRFLQAAVTRLDGGRHAFVAEAFQAFRADPERVAPAGLSLFHGVFAALAVRSSGAHSTLYAVGFGTKAGIAGLDWRGHASELRAMQLPLADLHSGATACVPQPGGNHTALAARAAGAHRALHALAAVVTVSEMLDYASGLAGRE